MTTNRVSPHVQAVFRKYINGPSITEEVQHIALLDLNRALSMSPKLGTCYLFVCLGGEGGRVGMG